MKFAYHRTIAYQHVGQNLRIRIDALVRLMQAAAIDHSDRAGFGIDRLLEERLGWMLFRTVVRIDQFPQYGRSFRIETWLNRYSRYKAYRCFRFFCDDQIVGEGMALYFFFNMGSQQFEHIPQTLLEAYTTEPDTVLCRDIDQWKPVKDWRPTQKSPFSIRYADLDTNGHVNHTVYFAFLETALVARFQQPLPPMEIRVQFSKEIGPAISNCQVGLGPQMQNDGYCFSIYNDQQIFTQGDLFII